MHVSPKLIAELFLVYSDPDFSGIIRIIRLIRRVDFDFHPSGIFVSVAARKELADDLSIRFDEGIGHPALEREYCVSEFREFHHLKAIIRRRPIILGTDPIREQISFRFQREDAQII